MKSLPKLNAVKLKTLSTDQTKQVKGGAIGGSCCNRVTMAC